MTETHAEVQERLRKQVFQPGGAVCPTCKQHAQVYRRTINSGMARSLIQLYRLDQGVADAFIHVPTALDARSREEGKLAYWGLLEEENTVRPDGGRSGFWRITDKGRRFALGLSVVPKYALIYDGRLLGLDYSEQISIHDALKRRFAYNDLMAGRA